MKSFDHIKVADYSLGATFISKWIYSMHKAALEDKKGLHKLPLIGSKVAFEPLLRSPR